MRIGLDIQRTLDEEAARSHRRIMLSRLFAKVRLRYAHGWSEDHLAIVDTGAPYTLIPLTLWAGLRFQRLRQVQMRGIVPGDRAEMTTTLAHVTLRVLDNTHTSPPLQVWAMLATTDRVPLILGWAGCFDRGRLLIDAPRHRAWLEL